MSKNKTDQWVVHIIGPDEVISHANELDALREANVVNKLLAGCYKQNLSPFSIALVKNLTKEEA